jgi:class 3 adenylate cyclase
MDQIKVTELTKLAKQYFDIASSHVRQNNDLNELLRKAIAGVPVSEEAELPGYEDKKVKFGKFENREFVVLMTDIRKSTEIINGPQGVINMFLIFYIYAGIVAKIVDENGGTATEFLGDGVLSLFDTKDEGLETALMSSMSTARTILEARQLVLNPFFSSVGLPNINFGIGIDHGITIVTKFGYRGDTDLKAFGKCAYNASKLSKGFNQINVAENTKSVWPIREGGMLVFGHPTVVDGKWAYPVVS